MKYIEGTPREQIVLFTDALDSVIDEDNPVRFIDAYIENLDLENIGIRHTPRRAGRPPYHPKLLLKIYVYSYLEGIRSSRKIMKECTRNTELKWLTEDLTPDFRTISDFRKNNHTALKNIFKDFLSLCHNLELFDFSVVGIDGTKMRAQQSANTVYHRNRIDEATERIKKQIEAYMHELENNDDNDDDRNGGGTLSREKITKRIEKLSAAMQKVEAAKKEFENNPKQKRIYQNDNDSRYMNDKGKIRPGYNAQTAVDAKEKIIVVADVTNEENDRHQMTPMLEHLSKAKKEFSTQIKTTAEMDCGYHCEEEIMAHKDDEEFDIVVPSPKDCEKSRDEKKQQKMKYNRENFRYDKTHDRFVCPEGKTLSRIVKEEGVKVNGRKSWVYKCHDCENCPSVSLCTKNKTGRTITVNVDHEAVELYRTKMQSDKYKRKIRERKELCEHPFGTLKRSLGYDYFLVRGLEKVRAEFSFMAFIYNLKRVLSMFTVKELIKAVQVAENFCADYFDCFLFRFFTAKCAILG